MLRIGILRGGGGHTHEASIASGAYPARLIAEKLTDKFRAYDIYIDQEGVWHFRGIPTDPRDLVGKVDVFVNALLGEYNNQMHQVSAFEGIGVPYTGARAFERMITQNHELAKERYCALGVKTPEGYRIDFKGEFGDEHAKNIAKSIWEKVAPPWIVRPVNHSSRVGVHECKTFGELVSALEENFYNRNDIFVEEVIAGQHVVITVVEDYRGETPYVFPALEFGTHNAKIVQLDTGLKAELAQLAGDIFHDFNIAHYASVHFIVSPKKGIYVDRVETHPHLGEKSHIMQGVSEVGGTHEGFLEHLITQALGK